MPSKMKGPCPQRAQSQSMSNKLEDSHERLLSLLLGSMSFFVYLFSLAYSQMAELLPLNLKRKWDQFDTKSLNSIKIIPQTPILSNDL
jgi:hypothetical protein